MPSTDAPTTPAAYIAAQPPERRKTLTKVRQVIRANLPEGYVERIAWGAISYEVPLSIYPDTYNKKPLSYVALGAQKNHLALYMMCAYENSPMLERLRTGFAAAGLKLDMGKACLRFKTLEDLPLDLIGEVVASVPMADYVAQAKALRKR